MRKDILWINDPSRIFQAMNAPGHPTIVSYDQTGWLVDPDEPSHREFHTCCAQSEGWCDAIPVWRITRKEGYIVSRRHYCESHLPESVRQFVLSREISPVATESWSEARKKRKAYIAELRVEMRPVVSSMTRAQLKEAVLKAHDEGMSYNEIRRVYSVDPHTTSNWRKQKQDA